MPYPEFDFSGQGTAGGAPAFDFTGGAVLGQEEEQKKPQRTLLNETADIILNRPRQALLAPAIYDAKHNDGFLNDLKGGTEEFVAALKGQRPEATGAAYLEAKGMGDGLARDIAGGLLDVVTTPAFGPIVKGGQAIAGKVLPQAGKAVKNLYGAAAAGGIYGAAEGIAEAKPWGEVALSAADQAAMWPIFDGAFMGMGKVAGDARGLIERELNKARPGELLNFRNVPGMEGRVNIAPGANNATPDEIIADQQAKEYPWSTLREEQGNYINEQAMAEAQAARQQEIMAAQRGQEYPWTRESQYTAPVTRPPLTNDQPALTGGADFVVGEQGAKIYPWSKEVPRRGFPVQDIGGLQEAAATVTDPVLQKELQATYDAIIAKQQDYLLANAKKGVETSKGAYDLEGNNVGWNAGFSKNDEWYRRLSDELGRTPSKKEIRAMAERTLRQGHDDIPPDANFLKAEAELKAGRRLPDEWHTMNAEIEKLKWEYPNNPEIYDYVLAMEKERDALLRRGTLDQPVNNTDALEFVQAADAQRKGLAQILAEKEAAARQNIQARNEAYKTGTDNIVARNPLDDIQDLAIIGASKIARGLTNIKDWAAEMVAEFGEIIRAKLPEIYERAKAVMGNEQGSIKLPFGKEKVQPLAPEGPDTMSHIISKTGKEPRQWGELLGRAYSKAVNDQHAIGAKFDTAADQAHFAATGKHLDPKDQAKLAAMNSKEAGGRALNIVQNNLVDRAGNIIGPSLKSIVEKVPIGRWREAGDYLILQNAASWMAKGKQVYSKKFPEFYEPTEKIRLNLEKIETVKQYKSLDDSQKAEVIAALNKENESFMAQINKVIDQRKAMYDSQIPELKQFAQELYAFDRAFKQEWLVNSGHLSPEEWAILQQEHPNYVKFQRKLDTIEQGGKDFKNNGTGQLVKRAIGSERPIVHPMESMVEDIDRIVRTVKKTEVRQVMYKQMQQHPEELSFLARIVKENEKTHQAPRTLEEGEIRDIIDDKIEELGFDPRHGNNLTVPINGKREQIRVYDPDLLKAIESLEPAAANIVLDSARQVTRFMKVLTTGVNPIFSVARSFVVDVPTAYINSTTLVKTPILREMQFAWGLIDSIARIATNGRYDPGKYYETAKGLGFGTHASSMAADRNTLAESMYAIKPKKEQSLGYKAKGLGRGLERFANALEATNRLPEYIRTVKQYGDTAEGREMGLFNAQDVTVNFSRGGEITKVADAFIPYLNASTQGLDKMARTFKNQPFEAAQRAFIAITIPSLILWAINKDDPDYQNLSSFTRDKYYCIPTGDGQFIKIAKPREYGVLFGSLPERCLDTWANDDPEGFRNFAQAWETAFFPAYRPVWAPFSDVRANENFAGAPIVPGYLEGLSPELQYDERTSAPAKAIGSVFGVSPKNLDYLANSYTGIIGDVVIPATAGGTGEGPISRVGDVFGRNLTADSLYSNEAITNFYTDKERLDTATRDFNATGKKSKYYDPDRLKMYNKASRDMSDLREQIRTVNASSMPYEQKQQITRQLQQKVVDIATQAANGTYGQSTDWISNWSNSLRSDYGTDDWQQDWKTGNQ